VPSANASAASLEQHAGEFSVASRQQQQPAGFRLETGGRDEGTSALADLLLD
jgi:hypothetical protein